MEMGGIFFKNLELYPPLPPLKLGSGEYFLVNFAKFFRTPFWLEHLCWLVLHIQIWMIQGSFTGHENWFLYILDFPRHLWKAVIIQRV